MNRIDILAIAIMMVIEICALVWFLLNGIFGVLNFILIFLILFNIWKLYTFMQD